MTKLSEAICMTCIAFWFGCSIPPDWSVCDCQWLDNHWFHHISVLDAHSGPGFLANLVTKGTRLNEWVMSQACPDQVHSFLYNAEAKVYSFDPAGVMKLSHEAWRPENRELIKNLCPVGNMILHFWCSHQFLFKAGDPSLPVNETVRWSYLRSWYAHMRSLQQFLSQEEITKCLPRSSFPFNDNTTQNLVEWSYKSIGNSSLGEEPRLLFNSANGLIHIPSFTYTGRLEHSRRNINPKNRVCIPMSDPSCWPTTAVWQADSCSLCCDPNKGPYGDPSCWRNGRTFERCCQQDFRHVKCEEIRKSTPGCLDCPQSLSFFCEEAHKFDAVKAWQHMNETYYEYLGELNMSRDLRSEIASNHTQLASLETLVYSQLPEVVKKQTQTSSLTSSWEYRSNLSRVLMANSTLDWLMRDMRPPVAKNHSVVSKELRSLTDKRRAANTTLFDNEKREVSEIQRKQWLQDRLYNDSIELPEIESAISAIDFLPLWESGNATAKMVISLNKSVSELEGLKSRIGDQINLTSLQLQARLTELGVLHPKDTGASGEELKKAEDSLTKARRSVEEMNARKADCDRHDESRKTIPEIEESLKNLEQALQRNMTLRDSLEAGALKAELDYLEVLQSHRTDLEVLESSNMQMHDLHDRMRYLHTVHTTSKWKLLELQHSGNFIIQRLKILDMLQHRLNSSICTCESESIDIVGKLNSLKQQLRGSQVELKIHQKRLVQERKRLRALKLRKRNQLSLQILESFLKNRIADILSDLNLFDRMLLKFVELIPGTLLPEPLSRAVSLRAHLIAIIGHLDPDQLERPSILNSIVSMIKFTKTRISSLTREILKARLYARDIEIRNQKREMLASQIGWLIGVQSVVAHDVSAIKNETDREKILIFESSVEMHAIQTAILRISHIIQTLTKGLTQVQTHQRMKESLGEEFQSVNTTMGYMQETRSKYFNQLSSLKNDLPKLKRNCRQFNERTHRSLGDALREWENTLQVVKERIANETEQAQELRNHIAELHVTDKILRDLNSTMYDLRSRMSQEIDPDLLNKSIELKESISSLKGINETIVALHRRNDTLHKRLCELNAEIPKLSGELDIKDEQILNATRKQSESRDILASLAPNITDKEYNLTMWTASLDLIDGEIKLVNSTLHERLQELRPPLSAVSNKTWMESFENVSRALNETFYNLTHVEDALVNSTKKTAELIEEFKKAEQTYFQKEAELKEYTRQVEAGIIPKVNFTFVY